MQKIAKIMIFYAFSNVFDMIWEVFDITDFMENAPDHLPGAFELVR